MVLKLAFITLLLDQADELYPDLKRKSFPQGFLNAFQSCSYRHWGGQNSLDGC